MYSNVLDPISFKRRETILTTAIDVMYQLGLQGLTTKEIAKREGITEPAVYRHFKGKQDIIMAIIKQFGHYDEAIYSTIVEQEIAPKAAITYFVNAFSMYYESYPQLMAVLFSYDVYRYDEETKATMEAILKRRYHFLEQLVQKGQQSGELQSNIEPQNMTTQLMGVFLSAALQWRMGVLEGSLRDHVMACVETVLK